MSGARRAAGIGLLARQSMTWQAVVVLALLSTVTSMLLLSGAGAAWADPGSGEGSSSSVEEEGGGSGGGSWEEDQVDSGDGGSGGGSGGSGQPEPSPEPRPADDEEEEPSAAEQFEELVREQREADALNKGVLSAFDVRDRDGAPVSAYRVYSDTGGVADWQLWVPDLLVQLCFTVIVWTISLTCWILAWALSFSLAALLFRPVHAVATSLHSNVFVAMGLPGLFLAVAMLVAAWHILFGARSRGWGEAAAALLISALSVGLLASPPDLLLSERDGIVGTVRDLATEIAGVTIGPLDDQRPLTPEEEHALEQDFNRGVDIRTPDLPDAPHELSRPITDALVDAFIARPAQLLSYGQTFEGECEAAFRDMQVRQRVYEQVLEEQLYGDDVIGNWIDNTLRKIPAVGGYLADYVRWQNEQFEAEAPGWDRYERNVKDEWKDILAVGPVKDFEESCVAGSASAKKASLEKVGGAVFALIAAVLAAAFTLLLVVTFLSAQFWLAIEAILAKLALVVGVLPGIGRAWMLARAAEILRRLLTMVASAGALGVFIVIVTELIRAPDSEIPGGLATRFVIIDLACIAGFVARKRLAAGADNLAQRTRERLNLSPLGGGTTSAARPLSVRTGAGLRALPIPGVGGTGSGFGGGGGRSAGMGALAGAVALGAATGGGSTAARALVRAPGRAVAGLARNTGRTGVVMARGANIGAGAATTAGRAVLTKAGRQQLAANARQTMTRAGTGLPASVPANAAGLRARIAALKAASVKKNGTPARPAGRLWVPSGSRPARRVGGPRAGRVTAAPAAPPPATGPAQVPPSVAAMRQRAARIRARHAAKATGVPGTTGTSPRRTGRGVPPVTGKNVRGSTPAPRKPRRRGRPGRSS
ncbi:hypothetical protein [Streptomyces xiamenensis]|uniref:hypothetical protein n=1 Tax=Streptomyces xiamenensis TaxID=408015 RepID=UPI0035DC8D1D